MYILPDLLYFVLRSIIADHGLLMESQSFLYSTYTYHIQKLKPTLCMLQIIPPKSKSRTNTVYIPVTRFLIAVATDKSSF